MLTQITVKNPEGSFDDLDLIFGEVTEVFQILKADGLGPVTAQLATAPYSSSDGEFFTNSFTGKRNIVLTLGVNPDWETNDVASLRNLAYQYFMPKRRLELEFFTTHLVEDVGIVGYVESVEPNIFSKDPEIQVSIICPDPDFVALESYEFEGTITLLATEILTEYIGTVPTGFTFQVDSTVGNVTYDGILTVNSAPLYPEGTDLELRESKMAQISWDVLVNATHSTKLDTRKGSKKITRFPVAGGADTNLLADIVGNPQWGLLYPGQNVITVTAGETGQAWTLTYTPRYGGL